MSSYCRKSCSPAIDGRRQGKYGSRTANAKAKRDMRVGMTAALVSDGIFLPFCREVLDDFFAMPASEVKRNNCTDDYAVSPPFKKITTL